MRNKLYKITTVALVLATTFTILSCSGDSGSSGGGSSGLKKEKITGISQKGPFAKGAVVRVYELNEKLIKTNKFFDGKTIDDNGNFEVEITNKELASKYIIIEVIGKYTNEVTGKQTEDSIKLNAIADVSGKSNVNINVLTHLEFEKVLKLAESGKDFAVAKKQAQKEVLNALGISEIGFENSEDISLGTSPNSSPSDQALYSISVLFQGNRSVAEVSDLLAKFGDEIRDKGTVSDSLKNEVKQPSEEPPAVPSSSSLELQSSSSEELSSSSAEISSSSTDVAVPSSSSIELPSSSSVVQPLPSSSSEAVAPSSSSAVPSSSSAVVSSSSELVTQSSSSEESSSSSIEVDESSSSSPTSGNAFMDGRDGKTYELVRIGGQTWMAKNLNYNAGGSKCGVLATSGSDAGSLTNEDTDVCGTYGRLYDWATAMSLFSDCNTNTCGSQITDKHQGICPDGWHIPSRTEWQTLESFVGGTDDAGTKLKATSGWSEGKTGNGIDEFGFAALPGGYGDNKGTLNYVGKIGDWWSSTESNPTSAFNIELSNNVDYSNSARAPSKANLFSVRCLQD